MPGKIFFQESLDDRFSTSKRPLRVFFSFVTVLDATLGKTMSQLKPLSEEKREKKKKLLKEKDNVELEVWDWELCGLGPSTNPPDTLTGWMDQKK